MNHNDIVEIFTYADDREVRVVMIEGTPWFCAADVCAVLAHSNSRMAVAGLDPDEKTTIRAHKSAGQDAPVSNPYGNTTGTSGHNRSLTYISESGLYSLILRSNKAGARSFRRWVTHDVLPAIRRNGRYTPVSSENAGTSSVETMDALLTRAIGSIADLADRTGDLTKAVEINTLAVARLTAGLSTPSPQAPPTSQTHSPSPVVHKEIHRVIHRPTALPTTGDRRRLSADVVADCRRRARDGVSVYQLAREHSVSDSTMRAAVRGQTYRYVPEPPVCP
jgi:prophage antirepressor-like protein